MSESACQLGRLGSAEVLLQRGCPPWLVAGGLSSAQHGLSTRLVFLTTLWLASTTVSDSRESEAETAMYFDLASEVTLHHFHGFITTDYAIGEPIRCDYARPSWRLAAPVVLINSISQALLKMLIEGPWLV